MEREDLAPLDEAAAFKRLLDSGLDAKRTSNAIKRSKRYVTLRLHMAEHLDDTAAKALRGGELNAERATAIARLDAAEQNAVVSAIRGGDPRVRNYKNIRAGVLSAASKYRAGPIRASVRCVAEGTTTISRPDRNSRGTDQDASSPATWDQMA